MERSTILTVFASLLALVLGILVLLQSGLFGTSLQVTSLLGVDRPVQRQQFTYADCVQQGGVVTLQIPKKCVLREVTVFESYAESDKTSYKTRIENEAAAQRITLLSPLGSGYGEARYEQIENQPVPHSALFTAKKNSLQLSAYILPEKFAGITDLEKDVLQSMINAKSVSDVQTKLGGNTAIVRVVDFSAKGFNQAVLLVDGEADKLFGETSVIVAGKVRENWVVLVAPFDFVEYQDTVTGCITNSAVIAQVDKERTSQDCFNTFLTSSTQKGAEIEALANDLVTTFSFEI